MKSIFDNVMESMLVAIVVMSVYAGSKVIREIPAMKSAMAQAATLK